MRNISAIKFLVLLAVLTTTAGYASAESRVVFRWKMDSAPIETGMPGNPEANPSNCPSLPSGMSASSVTETSNGCVYDAPSVTISTDVYSVASDSGFPNDRLLGVYEGLVIEEGRPRPKDS